MPGAAAATPTGGTPPPHTPGGGPLTSTPRQHHSARLLLGYSQSMSLLAHSAAALRGIKDASGARFQVGAD
jgi:hypothetical protein